MDPSLKLNTAQLAARNIKMAKSRHQRRTAIIQRENPSRNQSIPHTSEAGLFGGSIQASGTFDFAAPSALKLNPSSFGSQGNTTSDSSLISNNKLNGDDHKFESIFQTNKTIPNFCSGASSKPIEATSFSFQGGSQSNSFGVSSAPPTGFSFASTTQPATSSTFSFGNLAPGPLSGSSQILFGQNPDSSQSTTSKAGSNATASGSTALFGESNIKPACTVGTSTNIFGDQNANSTGTLRPTVGKFGDVSIKPASAPGTSANIFGDPKSTVTTGSSTLFGASSLNTSSTLGTPKNIFEDQNIKSTGISGPSGMFGVASIKTTSTADTSKNIFGGLNSKTAVTSGSCPLFEESSDKSSNTLATSKNIFGDQNAKSTGTSGTSGLFGDASIKSTSMADTSKNIFGNLNSNTAVTSKSCTLFEGSNDKSSSTLGTSKNIFADQNPKLTGASGPMGCCGNTSTELQTTSKAPVNIFAKLNAHSTSTSECNLDLFVDSNVKSTSTSETSQNIFAEQNVKSTAKSGPSGIFGDVSSKTTSTADTSKNIFGNLNSSSAITSGSSTLFEESKDKSSSILETSRNIFAEQTANSKETGATSIFGHSSTEPKTTSEPSADIFTQSITKSTSTSESDMGLFVDSNIKRSSIFDTPASMTGQQKANSMNSSGSTTCIFGKVSVMPETTLESSTSIFKLPNQKNFSSDTKVSPPLNTPTNSNNIFKNPPKAPANPSSDGRDPATTSLVPNDSAIISKPLLGSLATNSTISGGIKSAVLSHDNCVSQQQIAPSGSVSAIDDKQEISGSNTGIIKDSFQISSQNIFSKQLSAPNLFVQPKPENSLIPNSGFTSKLLSQSDPKESSGFKTAAPVVEFTSKSFQNFSNNSCNPFSSLKQDTNIPLNTSHNIFGFLENAPNNLKNPPQPEFSTSQDDHPPTTNDCYMSKRQGFDLEKETSNKVETPVVFGTLVNQTVTNPSDDSKLSEKSKSSLFQLSINTDNKSSCPSTPEQSTHLLNDSNSIQLSPPDNFHPLSLEEVKNNLSSTVNTPCIENSKPAHSAEESDKALVPYNPAPGSKRANIFAPEVTPDDPLLRKLALVSQIKDDDIQALQSLKSNEIDQQQYFATYRLRALNQAMARMFEDLPITSDPQVALNFYAEERRIILEDCSHLNNDSKRKADWEDIEQGLKKKRKQNVINDFTMLTESPATNKSPSRKRKLAEDEDDIQNPGKRSKSLETTTSSTVTNDMPKTGQNSFLSLDRSESFAQSRSSILSNKSQNQNTISTIKSPSPIFRGKRKASDDLEQNEKRPSLLKENLKASNTVEAPTTSKFKDSDTANKFRSIFDSSNSTINTPRTKVSIFDASKVSSSSNNNRDRFNPFAHLQLPSSSNSNSTSLTNELKLASPAFTTA